MRHVAVVMLMLLTASEALAQYPEPRWQWQPEFAEHGFDLDRRLEQPVTVEILGRSAVAALKMLSGKTEVDLSVSAEDLTTLGERKLTIIVKGLSLKGIMVQIPEALQECHWRIDTSGAQPMYQLHRNAGVAQFLEQAPGGERDRWQQVLENRRMERIAAASRALSLGQRQLAELEKTDLFLARAAKDPYARAQMEAFFSLSSEQMNQFIQQRRISFSYRDAPPSIQAAARASLAARLARAEHQIANPIPGEEPDPALLKEWADRARALLADPSGSTLSYQQVGNLEFDGLGIMLFVNSDGDVAIPVRCRRMLLRGDYYERLLLAAGTEDRDAAKKINDDWYKREIERQRQEQQQGWIPPTNRRLVRTVKLSELTVPDFAKFGKTVADMSGVSVISDYFAAPMYEVEPGKAPAELPLWRTLYFLGQANGYQWKAVDDCLLFHHERWYDLVRDEVPESLILEYERKLTENGRLTLDDVAAFAQALALRHIPANRGGFIALPLDLARTTGNAFNPPNFWALPLYASLSPEQVARAKSAAGLPYSTLTRTQRQSVDGIAVAHGIAADQTTNATFALSESAETNEQERFLAYDFRLQFPGHPAEAVAAHFWLPAGSKAGSG